MNKILIIEDDSLLLSDIMKILSLEGYEVLGAPNGLSGLDLARQQLPDLVICDVLMPGMDGYMVLLELRSDPLTSDIPLVFLTAKAEREDIRRGMEMGADDYLSKPFTHSELLSAIQTRLRKYRVLTGEYTEIMSGLRQNLVHALPQELHAPLNGILQFSRVLIEDANGLAPTQLYQIAHGIERAAERIHSLIENYLVYVQLELLATNAPRLAALQAHVINAPCELIQAAVNAKAREFERSEDLQWQCTDVPIRIEGHNLGKAAGELAEYAFRISSVGMPVEVRTQVEAEFFILSIGTSGRGLTSAQLAHIGSPQYFENSVYEHQSVELGLVIARRLVELHQGEFHLESSPETGTIFTLKLRRAE